jgi:hypothetical protein
MLERIAVRPAGLGAAVAMVAYLLVTVTLVPAAADVLVEGGPAVASTVIVLASLLAALLGGWATVVRLRRHQRYPSRGSAVPTLVVVGVLATLVLAVLGSAASVAAGRPVDLAGIPALLVTMVLGALPAVWLVRPAAEGYAYVPHARPRDAGQGSVEMLGITTVAVVLVGAIVVAMAPGGRWLSDELRVQFCRLITLGQGNCGSSEPPLAEPRPEPTQACVRNDTTDDRGMSVSVMWVQAENGALIRVEKMSDDTYRISREGSGSLGGQVDTGLGVTVTVDDKTVGGEAVASAAAALTGGLGATWVVDSEAEKEQLVSYLKDERNWDSVQGVLAAGGFLGQTAGMIGDAGRAVWNWATDAYEPPAPDEVYGYAGVEGKAAASATGLVQHAEASLETSQVLGTRVDTKTGAMTVYYEGQIDLGGGYESLLEGSEIGASGTVRPLVAVTYDPEGLPLNVQVQGVAAGEAKLVVGQMFGDDLVNKNPNGGFIFDARVSVTGDETRDIALGLMRASGIPINTPTARFDGAADAVGTFMDAARERGTLTRQEINIEGGTDFAINANGKFGGVGVGGSFENSTETITTTDADYWDGSRWRTWASCLA